MNLIVFYFFISVTQVKGLHLKQQKKFKKLKKPTKPVSLIDDKLEWNGTLFPFRGTLELYGERIQETNSDFDDSEWLDTQREKPAEIVQFKNALGALMSAYDSDNDVIEEIPTKENNKNEADNDEAPLEVKINREPDQCTVAQQQHNVVVNKRKRKKLKPAKLNKKSRFEMPQAENVKTSFIDTPFKKRRVTLLERLLDSEIRHERNVLLQCVRFVVENNYFKKM